jgi:cytidylate kinase
MTTFENIITIDGASGSGKTALLRGLSARFGCAAVELGPVVRAVAWLASNQRLGVADAIAVLVRLEATNRLRIDQPGSADLAASEVVLDGRPLRQQAFSGRLNEAVAAASLDSDVMRWIHGLVRESLRGRVALLSAREGASAVCPTAGLRIRLEASSAVRGARKRRQMIESGLRPVWVDDIRLLQRPDAVHAIIDTTSLGPTQVADLVAEMAQRRLGWKQPNCRPEPLIEPARLISVG